MTCFNAEVADTWGIGRQEPVSRPAAETRICRYFHTKSHKRVLLLLSMPTTLDNRISVNLDATYKGVELELNAKAHRPDRPVRELRLHRWQRSPAWRIPRFVGNKPGRCLTKNTIGLGAAVTASRSSTGLTARLRLDYQENWPNLVGPVQCKPHAIPSNPGRPCGPASRGNDGRWTAWSKNLTNKIYNAEFSTGGFLWRALPRRYGVDVNL